MEEYFGFLELKDLWKSGILKACTQDSTSRGFAAESAVELADSSTIHVQANST